MTSHILGKTLRIFTYSVFITSGADQVRHAQTTLAQFFSSPKSSNRGYDGQPSPSSSNKRLGVDMRIGDNVSDAEGVCGEGSEECGSTPSKIEKDVGHSSSDNRASENALQEVRNGLSFFASPSILWRVQMLI